MIILDYNLVVPSEHDIERLIEYKRRTIFDYAENLSDEEIKKIENYITINIPKELNNYRNIVVNDNIVGCLLITEENGVKLLDEIYLEEEYRNKGIGSDIIKSILKENDIIYLWVYKLNHKAISLYKKLGFFVDEETEIRYHMKYEKNSLY